MEKIEFLIFLNIEIFYNMENNQEQLRKQAEQQQNAEEMLNLLLHDILSKEAKERLNTVKSVKPAVADRAQKHLITQ